jgi:hypothetical protein
VELRDLVVTPVIIIIVYAIAYFARPYVTDDITRRYFLPALTVKILGALSLGIIYQFYYQGGDTYNYFTHGSRIIWQAFMQDPAAGLKLIFNPDSGSDPRLFQYTSRILFASDPNSYFVIRITALLDLLTFSTYTGTAVLYATMSFIGMWLLFLTFYQSYPHLHRRIAIAAFFIPSVFFWGSGILKDTIILACLGGASYSIKSVFIDKRISLSSILILLISLSLMYQIKRYVLLCFLPASVFWIFSGNLSRIRSMVLKVLLIPITISVAAASGYFAVKKVSENDSKYALDKLAHTARVTAYDIGFYTGKNAGSSYSLGELDGSFLGMLKLAPKAINASLFRPYLWEVRNPLMLLSSLESLVLFIFTAYLIFRIRSNIFSTLSNPNILFCLMFSVTFAFAVGVSTFNFGTLSRYKIPLLPFYVIGLAIISDQSNKDRNVDLLEPTE